MRLKLKFIAGTAAVAILAFAAPAQDASNLWTDGQRDVSNHQFNPGGLLKDAFKASDLIGMNVDNYQNEKLGKVADLAVDLESGRIIEVILSTGGFLGMDKTFTAVPPELLHPGAGHKLLNLDASLAIFNGAPKFDLVHWNQSTQSNRVTEVYDYYGVQPYFVASHGEYRTDNVNGVFASSLPRNMDGTINTAGASTTATMHNKEIARAMAEPTHSALTEYPNGIWTTNNFTHPDGAVSYWSSLVYVQKLTGLMGKPVKNLQAEKLGKVDNLMLDLAAGRITAVIISSGGFIGAGNVLSAVSPTELRYGAEDHSLQLDSSKEKLASFTIHQP